MVGEESNKFRIHVKQELVTIRREPVGSRLSLN